ncbi:MAG: ParA family protein [bacterium]
MSRVISIACQKGGVGKTTTALNLGISLNILGKKILLIDLDPQGCLGIAFDIDQNSLSLGIYELVVKGYKANDVIHRTCIKNIHIIPINAWSKPAGDAITKALTNLRAIKRAIDEVRDEYDFILIDCPPSILENTLSALYVSDSILIPVQTDYYVFMVLDQFLRSISVIQQSINPKLTIDGLLLTMFDNRLKSSQEILKMSWEKYNPYIFKTIIPRSTELAQVIYTKKPITIYLPRPSKGALAYISLAREFLKRYEETKPTMAISNPTSND